MSELREEYRVVWRSSVLGVHRSLDEAAESMANSGLKDVGARIERRTVSDWEDCTPASPSASGSEGGGE